MGNEILPAIFSITPYNVIIVFLLLSTKFAAEKGLIDALLPLANISDIAFQCCTTKISKNFENVRPSLVLELCKYRCSKPLMSVKINNQELPSLFNAKCTLI